MPLSLKSPVAVFAGIFVVVLSGVAIWWVLADSSNVLFDHVTPAQLNSISAELDRAGISYSIDREKSSIIVADKDARRARLLATSAGTMTPDSTGFELFDKSDFGMTDFAQKINYQRAMEGEIARTVSSLAGVKYARVHLVLPEHGLFHNEKQKPRASVTLFLDEDAELGTEQIRSVQRIAASAVPDLSERDTTVINQNGVTLSAASDGSEQSVSSPARLAEKKAVESYMADKVRRVLEKALGANRFAVSVDATLDLNQKTTTTEKVLENGSESGGIKRVKSSNSRKNGDVGGQDSTREVEYVLGHQSEQIVYSSGEIRHIQVGVIIDSGVEGIDTAKLRDLVATAVGIDSARGDKVTIIQNSVAVQNAIQEWTAPTTASISAPGKADGPVPTRIALLVTFVAGLLLGILTLSYLHGRRQKSREKVEVQQLRQQLRQWVQGETLEVDRP